MLNICHGVVPKSNKNENKKKTQYKHSCNMVRLFKVQSCFAGVVECVRVLLVCRFCFYFYFCWSWPLPVQLKSLVETFWKFRSPVATRYRRCVYMCHTCLVYFIIRQLSATVFVLLVLL